MHHKNKDGGMSLIFTKKDNLVFEDYLLSNMDVLMQIANSNIVKNNNGQVVISKNDKWRFEIEWDIHFKELKEHGELFATLNEC